MSLGSAKTTLFKLGIRGIVGFTNEINNEQKTFFEGNSSESTLLLRTDASIAKVLNLVNKNAERLCRGKWSTHFDTRVALNCIQDNDLTLSAKTLAGKTLVLKNGNLQLTEYQEGTQSPLNVFIDKGNLLLPTQVNTGNMNDFDAF